MGEFLSNEKQKEILSQFPAEQRREVFQRLADRGYELEDYNAEFSFSEAGKNILPSAGVFVKSIWSAITHPVQTVNALDSVAGGAARSFWKAVGVQPKGYSEDDEGNFEAMVDFFVDRYGSTDKLLNTIEKDPVGFLSDASVVISGGAGAVSKIPALSKVALPTKVTSATGRFASAVEGSKIPLLARTAKELSGIKTVADIPAKTAKFARILEPATAVTKTARRLNKAVGLEKFAGRLTRDITGVGKEFIKKVGAEGRDFINKHGISGSLDQMSKQLEKVAGLTKNRVDELLGSVPGKFRNRDTLGLLNEELKVFSKETEDVISVIDEIPGEKIPVDDLTQKGLTRPGQVPSAEGITAQELIDVPGSYKQTLIVPKPNLSDESLATFNKIKQLRQKYLQEGLTLSEMNEVKRLSDQTLNIFKKTLGEVKESLKTQELGNLRASTQKFIEDQAANAGVPGIRQLNKQTQLSRAWKDVIDERILVGRERLSLWERLALVSGTLGVVTGSTVAGGLPGLAASIGLVGAVGVSRIPRIRTFLINRISLMTKTEFDKFLGDVEVFGKTRKMGDTLRKVRLEAMRYARPAGIAQQETEQQRIPIRTQ